MRLPPRPAAGASAPDPGLSTGSLGRALGALYTGGGLLALLWVLLPHQPDRGDGVVARMALVAIVLGAALALAGARLPTPALHGAIALIQVVIAVAYVAEAEPRSDVRLFFLWAAPYAALYFRGRAAALHLTWTAAAVAGSLALMPRSTRPAAYAAGLLLLGSLLATGLLVLLAARAVRRAERAQRHAATHDPLTGLPNRRRLLEVLRAVPGDGAAALVLLDLDRFELVHDRYGPAGGDALLAEVGRRLSGLVRPADVVARSAGAEFALVLRHVTGPDDALAVAVRALEAIETVGPAGLRARAGVRLLVGGDRSASRVLTDADAALDRATRAGGGRVVLWTTGMRPAGTEHLELAEDLRTALREGQLSLVYQPVVDIGTMRVLGVEVLTRWQHPVRGWVSPVEFIACAERTGFIDELTRWVLRTACLEATTWPVPADGRQVNVAINVSATQLADLRLVDDVRAALAAAGLPAGRVVLEVTETAEVVDLAQAERALDALRAIGLTLALDDFGTGFSSLTHVQALPFDILKVDRSFVAASCRDDRRAVATIAAVCALAEQLSVDVVAEGVEDVAELAALRGLGCTHAQGFGLARPMGAPALAAAMAGQGPTGWVLGAAAPVGAADR